MMEQAHEDIEDYEAIMVTELFVRRSYVSE
jgi:hypothetical protein